MIDFEKLILPNGLKVLVNTNKTTPMAFFNLLYNVGARDEDENLTGFAHLLEHLMFGGSINIPEFDIHLENAGGENNAFTTNDFTNYYITIPANNIETAFWLESDRMLNLAFSEKSLEVQQKVVIEEFKQRYLNQPYGDAFLKLRPLAYKSHPYKWATIGKDISHIEKATMQDVKSFYSKWYNPDNAILSICSPLDAETIFNLAEKWFGNINKAKTENKKYPKEKEQTEKRELVIKADVPFRAIYQAFHMPDRLSKDYKVCDLISDLLSNGTSARLYQRLVKNKNYFSSLNAFISGDADPGLFFIQGELNENVTFSKVFKELNNEIDEIKNGNFSDKELEKVKNKFVSNFEFMKISGLNNAMNLAFYEWLGDANLLNNETSEYLSITKDDICQVAKNIFKESNLSQLIYEPLN